MTLVEEKTESRATNPVILGKENYEKRNASAGYGAGDDFFAVVYYEALPIY